MTIVTVAGLVAERTFEQRVPVTWERMVAYVNEDIETDPRSITVSDGNSEITGTLVGILIGQRGLVMISSDLELEPLRVWGVCPPVMSENGRFYFKVGEISYTISP